MKANKTITFFIFLCSRHGRRCFKAQAEGLRLSMRSILLSILIAGTLLVCSSCDNESNNSTTAIDRDYTLTLLGKTVTVTDTRTGAADKSLEALGVMEKLRVGVALINNNTNMQTETRDAYDRVLAKGLVIIVEKPAVAYEGTYFKTKNDGNTILFDIDTIASAETSINNVAGKLNMGIVEYLDKGLDFE